MYRSFILSAKRYSDLDTEIKFDIAVARAKEAQLVAFDMEIPSDEEQGTKLRASAQKILRALAKARIIEFFIKGDDISSDGMEAEFLRNKFCEHLNLDSPQEYYVKL